MSITGSSSIRGLKDAAVVVDLDELGPVGGRSTGRRDGRRLERFAEMCQGLTSRGRSHPGLLPLADIPAGECRHGPLGAVAPLEPALESLGHNSVERRLLGAVTLVATGRRRAAVVFVALVTAAAGDVGQ